MAIHNRDGPTLMIGQSFIAFEAIVDVPQAGAQPIGFQPSMHPSQSVRAGWFFRQPGFEDRGVVELLPGVKTSQPGPEQNSGGLDHRGGGTPGSLATITQGGAAKLGEKSKIFSAYAIRRRRMILGLPFPQTLPFQLRDFFDELLHLLVAGDGLANPLLPGFGYADLARLAVVALN